MNGKIMKVKVLPTRFWLVPAVFGYCVTTIAYNNADFRPPTPVVPAPPAVGTPDASSPSVGWDCGGEWDDEECES